MQIPVHVTGIESDANNISEGSVIVTVLVSVQPFASVTSTLYVPEGKPVAVESVIPPGASYQL